MKINKKKQELFGTFLNNSLYETEKCPKQLKIIDYGWNETRESNFNELNIYNGIPGRIMEEHRDLFKVFTEDGIINAKCSGKMHYENQNSNPVTGDWIILSKTEDNYMGLIHRILPRTSSFTRKIAGNTFSAQVIAANFEYVFIVMSLNYDFNLAKLERYISVAYESKAIPVIILTKADLCTNAVEKKVQAEEIAFGVPIHTISAVNGYCMDEIDSYLKPQTTIAILGASGVGKSTLVNALAKNDIMLTKEIREDDSHGRHTTTHRQMIFLDNGTMLIDTPGMRELGLYSNAESGVDYAFGDVVEEIDRYALDCKFRDCAHNNEPGCAVRAAIENGEISKARHDSYIKLLKEARFVERKSNQKANMLEKQKWKQISKKIKKYYKKR